MKIIESIKKVCNRFTPRDSLFALYAVLFGVFAVIGYNIAAILVPMIGNFLKG